MEWAGREEEELAGQGQKDSGLPPGVVIEEDDDF